MQTVENPEYPSASLLVKGNEQRGYCVAFYFEAKRFLLKDARKHRKLLDAYIFLEISPLPQTNDIIHKG